MGYLWMKLPNLSAVDFSRFGQRRAGEADVAGVGEDALHLGVHGAVLAAVAFVHQHKDVDALVLDLLARGLVELVDDRRDDVGSLLAVVQLAGDQPHQVPAAVGLDHRLAAGVEGAVDLVVQVDPVGDQNHVRIGDGGMQGQRLGQHDHGQRLAAAGGVPDDAAGARALGVAVGDAVDGGLDGEILLVAGDLLDAVVVDDELVDQLQQALGAQQCVEQPVLGGGQALAQLGEVVANAAAVLTPVVEPIFSSASSSGWLMSAWTPLHLPGSWNRPFGFPHASSSSPRHSDQNFLFVARRGIERVVGADGQEQLRVGKELGNLLLALVFEQLLNAQRHRLLAVMFLVGPLALDDDQRECR